MTNTEWLEVAANIAALLTAGAAAWAYGSYRCGIWKRRRRLECYLEEASHDELPKRTVLRLMAELGMTESEILQASFGSDCIRRSVAVDPHTNRATAILFEYEQD